MQPWLSLFDHDLCADMFAALARGDDASPFLNAATTQHTNAQGQPLRFVAHSELPPNRAYEQFIYDTGCVPTRSLAGSKGAMHDACNALMWVHFPHTKAKLNALQAAAIRADGIQGTRGRLRDALTLFDESAVIVCCPADDAAPAQLAQRDWTALLHTRRSDWHQTLLPLLFGHAVLQKLQVPYLAITAQVWVLYTEARSLSDIDLALAESLSANLTPVGLLPLPVLGIPQWWAGNEAPAFYDNRQVFRPLPSSITQS